MLFDGDGDGEDATVEFFFYETVTQRKHQH